MCRYLQLEFCNRLFQMLCWTQTNLLSSLRFYNSYKIITNTLGSLGKRLRFVSLAAFLPPSMSIGLYRMLAHIRVDQSRNNRSLLFKPGLHNHSRCSTSLNIGPPCTIAHKHVPINLCYVYKKSRLDMCVMRITFPRKQWHNVYAA